MILWYKMSYLKTTGIYTGTLHLMSASFTVPWSNKILAYQSLLFPLMAIKTRININRTWNFDV